MPIVIQELIASDTLSQAVDKINFNFDQLLLNGGGPVGPAGIQGPTGPIGGRGIRGATWYDGSADPNTLIIAGIEEDDYFLQTNGQVWQYNGTVWIQTPVNLTGPTGAAGSAAGFDYVGGYNGVNPPTSINNENVAFVVPMPDGISGGANQLTNQGVSTVLLGAVGSTANPPAGITYSSAFQIPDTMAVQLDSSLVSVLIHQKDSSSSAIRFMGGGDSLSDKYEQTVLSNLSNITLGIDDTFDINVPKATTSPTSLFELIGFNLNTIRRGQQFYSGKQINFITGTDGISSGFAGEISDVTFTVNTSNASNPAKFSVSTTLPSANAVFEVGGNISLLDSTTKVGFIQLDAGDINLIAASRIRLRTSGGHGIQIRTTGIFITGDTGAINIATTSGQSIGMISDDSLTISSAAAMQIQSALSINVFSATITNAANQINLSGGANTHFLRVDNLSVTNGGIKLQGNVVWAETNLVNPFVTTHRNISIVKSTSLLAARSPVYIGHPSLGLGKSLMIEAFKGLSQPAAIEYARMNTASFEVVNTSGNAGFVGYTIENSSASMPAGNVGFRLRGIDRSGGNQAVATKFHASEDTTAVHNRMQYVRRTVTIDPLYAGITGGSAGTGFTIPATAMDATFLDIVIAAQGVVAKVDNGVSDSEWDLFIPAGTYVGQRLIVHVIAKGTSLSSPPFRTWPISAGGAINIRVVRGTSGTGYSSTQVARMSVAGSNDSYTGSEFFIELLWVGTAYSSFEDFGSGGNFVFRTTGWLITNGSGLVDSTLGTYRAVQNSQQWV